MKAIRVLLFMPIVVFALPAIFIIVLIVLLAETKEVPLRNILIFDVRRHGFAHGIKQFMQKVFIPTFRYNIQAFVLGGAGFLVITVGLRGLGVLPLELVYASLSLEFTMLMLWAITVFFTASDLEEGTKTGTMVLPPPPPLERDPGLIKALGTVTAQFDQLGMRIAGLEMKMAQMNTLEGTIRGLSGRLDVVASDEFVQRFTKEFEKFGVLDESLKALASKFDILVNDQLNLRVKQEFDHLLAELTERTVGHGRTGK
jgi:hypothetical protein